MLHTLGELAYKVLGNPPFFLSSLRTLRLQMRGGGRGTLYQAFSREFLGIELRLPGS